MVKTTTHKMDYSLQQKFNFMKVNKRILRDIDKGKSDMDLREKYKISNDRYNEILQFYAEVVSPLSQMPTIAQQQVKERSTLSRLPSQFIVSNRRL